MLTHHSLGPAELAALTGAWRPRKGQSSLNGPRSMRKRRTAVATKQFMRDRLVRCRVKKARAPALEPGWGLGPKPHLFVPGGPARLGRPCRRSAVSPRRRRDPRASRSRTEASAASRSPRSTRRRPEHPGTHKGRIRVDMEVKLRRASATGLRVLVLRCGDFFGPHAPSFWLTGGIASSPKRILTPERPGIVHAWYHLPDAAAALTCLLEHEASLPAFARFGFRGHVLTGRGMAEAVQEVRGGGRIWPFHGPSRARPHRSTRSCGRCSRCALSGRDLSHWTTHASSR